MCFILLNRLLAKRVDTRFVIAGGVILIITLAFTSLSPAGFGDAGDREVVDHGASQRPRDRGPRQHRLRRRGKTARSGRA
jgi:hypothetical protein